MGWGNSTGGKALTLYIADGGSIPEHQMVHQALPKGFLDCRVRSKHKLWPQNRQQKRFISPRHSSHIIFSLTLYKKLPKTTQKVTFLNYKLCFTANFWSRGSYFKSVVIGCEAF